MRSIFKDASSDLPPSASEGAGTILGGDMREKDITKGTFWKDGERIADFLNVNVYGGEQKICAQDVRELSETVKTSLAGQNHTSLAGSGARYSVSRTADTAKEVRVGESCFYLYLENQEKVDYAMVERCGLLEAASYQEQRLQSRQRHRQEKDLKKAEFLSGFGREEKLTPVVVLVLYYGQETWDAATSRNELLALPTEDERLGQMVHNYQLHLYDVARMENLEEYRTDIREVFSFVKYAGDQEKLRAYIQANRERFEGLREDTYDFIAVMTGSGPLKKIKEKIKDKEGGCNMCKAIDDMIKEGRREGRREGKREGRREGKREGKLEGIKAGRREGEISRQKSMSTMITRLLDAGRIDDLRQAAGDAAYCQQIFQELGIG